MSFIFDGQQLSDFGYVEYAEGLKSDNVVVSGMNFDTIKGATSDISLKVGHNYGENYSTTLLVMKDRCVWKEDEFLTDDDISILTRWLVRKQYKWFKYTEKDVWYKVQNTIEKAYLGEDVIGLSIHVNANAPYGFTDVISTTFTDKEFGLRVVSDEEGYIYPNVTLIPEETGDLILTNERTQDETRINRVSSGEMITIYGDSILQITTDKEDHDIAADFNYVFPKLYNEYNNALNEFTTNLKCSTIIEYRGIRKVGL